MTDELTASLGQRAATALRAAGMRALARDDHHAAINLPTRAARLVGDRERGELLLHVALSKWDTGDLSGSMRDFEDVTSAAALTGDEELAARAEVWRLMSLMMTDPTADQAHLLGMVDRLEALAKEVGSTRGLMVVEFGRSEIALMACRWTETLSALERARALLTPSEDPSMWIEIHVSAWNAVRYGPMPAADAIKRIEAEQSSFPAPAVGRSGFIGPLMAMLGRFAEARAMVADVRAYLLERGMMRAVGGTSLPAGYIELMAEDYEAADKEYASGIAILRGMGETGVLSTLAALQALALYRLGRREEMDAAVALARETGAPNDIATQAEWRAVAGMAAADDGNDEEATRLVGEAVGQVEPTDFCELRADVFDALAHVEARAGRTDGWRAALDRALAEYQQKGIIVGEARIRRQLEEGPPAPAS
jgi:hypothetical protein